MATDLLGFGGPWPVPRACSLCSATIDPTLTTQPTVRVHGTYQFMHVCDAHRETAERIVGEPYIVTPLLGAWVTSDDLEREEAILSHRREGQE